MESLKSYDIVVVGAGFFGLTIAERAANVLGRKVCILERQARTSAATPTPRSTPRPGSNIHKYGSHLFHCNSARTSGTISTNSPTFTELPAQGRHRPSKGKAYPMPIGLATICAFFGRYMTPTEAREADRRRRSTPKNLPGAGEPRRKGDLADRPAALRGVHQAATPRSNGRPTPLELPASIITRLPVRFNFERRLLRRPLRRAPGRRLHRDLPQDDRLAADRRPHWPPTSSPSRRQLSRRTSWSSTPGRSTATSTTRPANSAGGRSTSRRRSSTVDDYQGTSVLNYADEDVPYTRVHEFKHLHPERKYRARPVGHLPRAYSRAATQGRRAVLSDQHRPATRRRMNRTRKWPTGSRISSWAGGSDRTSTWTCTRPSARR